MTDLDLAKLTGDALIASLRAEVARLAGEVDQLRCDKDGMQELINGRVAEVARLAAELGEAREIIDRWKRGSAAQVDAETRALRKDVTR